MNRNQMVIVMIALGVASVALIFVGTALLALLGDERGGAFATFGALAGIAFASLNIAYHYPAPTQLNVSP